MGSASTHRAGPERVQFTVAELLGRCGDGRADLYGDTPPGHRRGEVDSVPVGWPNGTAPAGRRLAAAAGAVVAAGSIAAAAALGAQQPVPSGGPMGAGAGGAGHPVGERPRPRAVAPEPRRVTPLARVTPVQPLRARPVRRPDPVPRRSDPARRADRPTIRDEGAVRAPAGSALSGLTAVIGPVESLGSLLGGLGR